MKLDCKVKNTTFQNRIMQWTANELPHATYAMFCCCSRCVEYCLPHWPIQQQSLLSLAFNYAFDLASNFWKEELLPTQTEHISKLGSMQKPSIKFQNPTSQCLQLGGIIMTRDGHRPGLSLWARQPPNWLTNWTLSQGLAWTEPVWGQHALATSR